MYFSKHVQEEEKLTLAATFGMRVSDAKGKYLRLSYLIGSNKKKFSFMYMTD